MKIPSDATRLASKNKTKSSKQSSKRYASSSPPSSEGSGSSTYKVRSGDTLWDIARQYGTATSRLRQLNGLGRSSRIYPGQVLQVGGGEGSDYVMYKVRRGDTLSRIASRYRTTIAKILAANGLTNPDNLPVGLTLKINLK
jgi:LysM repeat protein